MAIWNVNKSRQYGNKSRYRDNKSLYRDNKLITNTAYTISPGEQVFRASAQPYSLYSLSRGTDLPRNRATLVSPGEQIFHTTVQHYSLSRGTDLPRNRATLQSLPGNRSSAHPRNRAFSTGHREPPNSLPRLRETPYSTTSLLYTGPSSSRLPRKGGYPQLLRKRLTLLPGLVRRPGISHLGVNHGHRNAPHTILCQSIEMPDSCGLGSPPSRTLLLSGRGLPDNPTSRLSIRLKSLEFMH